MYQQAMQSHGLHDGRGQGGGVSNGGGKYTGRGRREGGRRNTRGGGCREKFKMNFTSLRNISRKKKSTPRRKSQGEGAGNSDPPDPHPTCL